MGKSLVNLNYGKLLVKEDLGYLSGKEKNYLCECECGNTKIARGSRLKSGAIKDCGCVREAENNLIGKVFGRLTVTSYAGMKKTSRTWWCDCSCGSTNIQCSTNTLNTGHTQSCGCLAKEKRADGRRRASTDVTDLIGERFNRLTVMKHTFINNKTHWVCECSCGVEKTVSTYDLRSGSVQSCGCLHKDIVTTHNKSNSRSYNAWASMKKRCNNPSHKSWDSYGGRGIVVCDRWLESFENFYADMGEPPEGMSLERKNNDLGYSPDNCKWATLVEQQNNRRVNVFIEFEGEHLTVAQLARKYSIDVRLLRKRIQAGWNIYDAIHTPSKRKLASTTQ